MEAQLKQYRAKQRRQAILDSAKQQYEKSKAKLMKLVIPKGIFEDMSEQREEHDLLMEKEAPPPPLHPGRKPIQPFDEFDLSDVDADSEVSVVEAFDDKEIPPCRFCVFRGFWYFITWAFVWGIFLHYQIGAVYFVLSALIAIYFNTRTGPKRPGEISAYSVFNKNCASIEGTLNPEQFEREIRYGIGSVGSHTV